MARIMFGYKIRTQDGNSVPFAGCLDRETDVRAHTYGTTEHVRTRTHARRHWRAAHGIGHVLGGVGTPGENYPGPR